MSNVLREKISAVCDPDGTCDKELPSDCIQENDNLIKIGALRISKIRGMINDGQYDLSVADAKFEAVPFARGIAIVLVVSGKPEQVEDLNNYRIAGWVTSARYSEAGSINSRLNDALTTIRRHVS